MKLSRTLQKNALDEFQEHFGEILSEFKQDQEIYALMVSQFLAGVEAGMCFNGLSEKGFERLAEDSFTPAKQACGVRKAVGDQVALCAKLVFLYGVNWGRQAISVRL